MYLFVRRLAVKPGNIGGGTIFFAKEKAFFEWQRMPPGYRWF